MRFWFQNLNKDGHSKRWFNFRGSIGSELRRFFSYEIASGRALKLNYCHGECGDASNSSQLTIGLIFFTAYITFELPSKFYFRKRCVATWDNDSEFFLIEGRQYGFYFYEWAFVWSFHSKINESSSRDPWWMSQYIHIDDLFLGRRERLEDQLLSEENIHFKIGGKNFVMNSIKWKRNRSFRRFIPYSLYHRTWYSVQMKIEKPPMRAGKGENSWDCGDDGCFGMSGPWDGQVPGWKNRDECVRAAVEYYVKSVLKDAKRYGAGDGENGIKSDDSFEFIGRVLTEASA